VAAPHKHSVGRADFVTEPLDRVLANLQQDAREHLGEVRDAEAVLDVAAKLLRERESLVTTEWLETDELSCRLRFGQEGAAWYAGYGPNRLVAAVRCFAIVWHEVRYLPSLPSASPTELGLLDSHQTIAAITSYMNRVGVGLDVARSKLQV
jgi:hypothetical protein